MGQRKARFAAAACMVSISLMLGACKSGVPADSAPKAAETGQEELKLVSGITIMMRRSSTWTG